MEKPILIGSPDGACAFAGVKNMAIAAAAKNEATAPRHFSRASMRSSKLADVLTGTLWRSLPTTIALSSPPHFAGDVDDHPQFRPFLLLGEDIAFLRRGEAALRRQAELLERRKFARFVDAAFDVVLLLQRAALGRDETQHHDLVALGQEAQRLESAGALGIVFEEVTVVVHLAQERLRHRLVAALGNPGRAEIAAAHMGGDGHVGGLGLERAVDHPRVDALELIDVGHPLARLAQFLLRAKIGPHRVVELQVAAAGIVESFHRLLIGIADIVEELIEIGVNVLLDAVLGQTEMQHRRRRDGHLRRDFGVRLEKFEVLEHRMLGEADLADDAQPLRLGLHAAELDALLGLVDFDAVEHAEKVEMPPGAAQLAVGRQLKPEFLLLLDDLFDLAVLDRFELGRRDGALLALGARLLERRGAQEAADVIGTERRFGPLHRSASLGSFNSEQRHQLKASSTTKRWALCPVARWGTSPSCAENAAAGSTSAPAARAGGGDAEIALQHRAIGGKVGARAFVDHLAALDDRRPVGHAEHLLRVLLDQDRRHAFVADDAPQRLQQLLDQDRGEA